MTHDEIRAVVAALSRPGLIEMGALYKELGGDDGDSEDYDEAHFMLMASGWHYDIWLDRYTRSGAA
jgi:hypothetical protein